MFFNLIVRNSKRSRKENGLFFSSLVISIVAFYIILSISNQDIMRFLQEMESDAVDKLDALGLEYESYLQSMGRQLFYMVAASYITSYLAIIFLVVSNTIIGVQFLMNQQRTGRRYQTLVRLGATYHALCGSARKQITWFMGLPVIVAAISSLFGVKSLFAGILSSEVKNAQGEMLVIAAIIILILCVVECIYMTVIKRSSDRYLLTLMQPQREE